MPLRLYVIKPVEEREQGHRPPGPRRDQGHAGVPAGPDGADEAAAPVALPRRARVPARAAPLLARRPHGVARATRTAVAPGLPRPPPRSRGPRKIYIKELIQAITLADRRSTRPTSATCTRTSRTGRRRSRGWRRASPDCRSRFTGHARDIYAPELNPKGWLQAQALRRALRRHLHRGQRPRTCRRSRRERERPPRLPRPLGGLHDPAARTATRPQRNGRLRILGVGRLVAKKGFDTLVDACAVLQERGVPFDALIVGQDDKDGEALRAQDRRARRRRSRFPARSARRSCWTSTAAPARCACRAGCSRPTATASRTCSSRRWPRARPSWRPNVSGIPELVEHEVNGLLVEPDDPRGARRRADAPARRPRAHAPPHRATAARRSRSASTASGSRSELADAVPRGGAR